MIRKTLITLAAFFLMIAFPLLAQTQKEKWLTYKDKTYPFSFVYPETIVEKNLKDEYETVFQGWRGEPTIEKPSEEEPPGVKYIVLGGLWIEGEPYALEIRDAWRDTYDGLAIIVFESSSVLKSTLDREIQEAQKEIACRVNGYTVRKSTVTMKGGVKATDYFFCHPRYDPGGDKSYTWLETVIWRIPKGLPEPVVLIAHYGVPVKKRASFIWKTNEEDEGHEEFVEKTPQELLKYKEKARQRTLKTLNSFKWQK